MLICPICETENKPKATHCEVCGERLTPPSPGEQLSPEESVSAFLADPPTRPATPHTVAPPARPPAPTLVPSDFDDLDDLDEDPPTAPSRPAAAPPKPVAAPPVAPPKPVAPPVAPTPAAPPKPAAVAPQPVAPPRIVSSGIPDARLVIYQSKQPVYTHPIATDETLLGRFDPVSGSYPELDLTPYDADARVSRKHAYIYRQNNEFFLYPVSNAGTQLNQTLVDMGAKAKLANGDVIILASALAMKFHVDA
jgi:hypothetical protein